MYLKKTSAEILSQLINLMDQLTNEQYSANLEILFNNSVGKHVRHVIEFFDLMIKGSTSGIIDYDTRPHDKELETDRLNARLKLLFILETVKKLDADKVLDMNVNYSLDSKDQLRIHTTLKRELIYNIEHTVHHMAIIKIAVRNTFPDISIADSFGVAYSTLKYNQETHVHGNVPADK